METIYLGLVIFLFMLAVFDLWVGVSNDAVNFLNSAIGAKAAKFRTIMIIAAIGIFCGATMSSGMMDIARHGIFRPEQFFFDELMCIFLAVMVTDIILLDIFNSLGLPTSTTVSMVFSLLGGTSGLTIVKLAHDTTGLSIADLMNTEKALSVIIAIFVSVAIAFFFGTIVQFLSRLLFTFNYKSHLKWKIGLFGGVAATAICYFMLVKGIRDMSFMTDDMRAYIDGHSMTFIVGGLIIFTVLMQILHWLKVDVFKVVVLLGTFALAMSFAGNDLVNFIGVPLAGFSSYQDYMAAGGGDVTQHMMGALNESAHTPVYFLAAAGIVMVISLMTSKKAHNVVKTSVDLARQDVGDEMFGSSRMARSIVRTTMNAFNSVMSITPMPVRNWVRKRFNQDEIILANGAAFDMVRASVNLVLAGLLIAVGTSLKLPLSTTYVAFMVAMGSSLADRAWGRESAVFRITGVLSVIGGWFITAGAAFTICFFVTLIMHFGGIIAIIAMIAIAAYSLIHSQIVFKRRNAKEKKTEAIKQIMQSTNNDEVLTLLRQHTREELSKVLAFTEENFERISIAFLHENLRVLRRAMGSVKFEKQLVKQMKRTGTLAMSRLDNKTVLEKGLYYFQGNDFASELVYSIGRFCEPCLEHIDNNFKPLDAIQKGEFTDVTKEITNLLQHCHSKMKDNNYQNLDEEIRKGNDLNGQLSLLKREELKRIQSQNNGSIKVSMVYLTMIQEAQNVVTYTINLMKVSRKFQTEE